MTAIARRLGVQDPSLYHHIASLDALLADVADHCSGRLVERLAAGRDGQDWRGVLPCSGGRAVQLCSGPPGLYELSRSEPVDPARARAASEPARAALTAVIESFGVANPTVDPMLTCFAPPHGVLALDRSGAISGAAQRAAVYRRVTDLVELLERLPGLQLVDRTEPRHRPANFVSGLETLPVRPA